MGKQVGSATVSYLESNLESIVSNLPIRMLSESHYLHSGYFGPVRRSWQSDGRDEISGKNLMWPIFVVNGPNQKQSISSLPGVYRMGINTILEQLTELVPLGLTSILLFPVLDDASGAQKDDHGSLALDPVANPVFSAIKAIKTKFGDDLEIACDVCLCTYTSHGHCGIFRKEKFTGETLIDNEASIRRLSEISVAFAQAGADIIAPSDMMDGRIAAIKDGLHKSGLGNKVAVLSYSVKFASSFYGPFRDAAHSAPSFGDRKRYQLPPASRGLAIRAANRDVEEGADMLMVKPGLPYIDMIREVKLKHPNHPMFAYQVSGEFAMLVHSANAGAFDLKAAVLESLISMRRAGADVIISYFTPRILTNWKDDKN